MTSGYPLSPPIHVLPGGLRVLVEPMPHTRSVSVGCFFRIGSAHDPAPGYGMAHFVEHMLFKGSAARPTPKLLCDAIEGLGGLLDAYTDVESTVYYAKVADIHFDRAIDVLADMLLQPRFDPADVAKEQRVIAEELRQTADTPSELVHTLLDAAMWGDQALGRDIAGDERSVATIGRDDVVGFWSSHYTQANMVVSIAGNIEPERAVAAVAEALAPMASGAPTPYPPSQPSNRGPSLKLVRDRSGQVNFCIGFVGVAQDDPDRRAMLVFDSVLGSGTSSRLFQAIREERGLAYNVGSYSREYHDTGKWIIYGSVEPGKLAECLTTVMGELRRAVAEGITDDELTLIKEQVKGGILLSLEDSWSVASRNGSHALRYGRVVPIERVVAEVEAVTRDDVLRVARRVVRLEGMHAALIGRVSSSARIEKLLALS